MRTGLPTLLLLALSPCFLTANALAQEARGPIVVIDQQLFDKHEELKAAIQARDEQNAKYEEQQQSVAELTKLVKSLDKTLSEAKANLESDYSRMIDNPSIDLAATQEKYQDAWSKVKQNQKQRLSEEQQLQELKHQLDLANSEVEAIEQSIEVLDQNKLRARAERLQEELQQAHTLSVSFTNRCQADMTIAQCDRQTRDLALQKAVKQFQSELIASTSEPQVVKLNANKVPFNIHVLRSKSKESGFYDGVRYRSLMDVEMQARPTQSAACTLLGIDKQYCFEPETLSDKDAFVSNKEVAWVTLTIRSNLFDDNVTINGVNYGSTPVEVMLPVGPHMITVEKEGYRSFHRELTVKRDQNLRAVLVEKANPLREGDKFADSLGSGLQGPELSTILSGQYLVGEHGSKQLKLKHPLGFGTTPITVGQFKAFVDATNYQTDAELKNTCTAIVKGEVTPISKGYWRNPGFKQASNSPVVCVSRNDAQAYANWLSNKTNHSYRLPSEDEWEIAARAGAETYYWWGDQFIPNQANTGWGGTPWSNKSTSPVNAFKPNRLGIYDTVGNVWQWTSDARGLLKGGAWNFSPDMAAAHQQLSLSSSSAANYVGFRVVRDIH
ncbi:SUMF1/EgtB/PvdO family nonheme iron enzyme [Vibrio sp. Isolate24]|uniref:SUMF1/EgtB/PvdO family nonheme iron enzyme n=1 Tax=Vibrio sp. Isolate24 TaxID=2908534 RepID=UPI001EFDAD99|nr:SUMF1/EgtB/PvdO family nonheme iron enzyme [Vibrio sp. Isolate24]MCG9677752.1 SUMF1/EgtB/PvdO family nonheme iron enzyme [Vibrio sp. Isolate24]